MPLPESLFCTKTKDQCDDLADMETACNSERPLSGGLPVCLVLAWATTLHGANLQIREAIMQGSEPNERQKFDERAA